MIRIHFVGDGPRDAATIPELVRTILEIDFEPSTNYYWARLHQGGGKGYHKKVLFALLQAKDLKASALVAVVDRDKDPKGERLEKLREGRDEHRNRSTQIPAALGEANPHGEAWLLDDEAAVREALRLDLGIPIPSARSTRDPKGELHSLITASKRRHEPSIGVLAEIARLVQPIRCNHKSQTGFENFVSEVNDELGPLKSKAVDDRDQSRPR